MELTKHYRNGLTPYFMVSHCECIGVHGYTLDKTYVES